jgi:predicted RNase H-like nuclease (RuvC/YqgF family)
VQESSSEAQQLALQIIKSAGTFEIPAARRVTLRRALERSIRENAERRGVKPSVAEKDFVAHKGKVPYSEIIGAAVRDMAASSPQVEQRDARIRELERKIDELETESAALKANLRSKGPRVSKAHRPESP